MVAIVLPLRVATAVLSASANICMEFSFYNRWLHLLDLLRAGGVFHCSFGVRSAQVFVWGAVVVYVCAFQMLCIPEELCFPQVSFPCQGPAVYRVSGLHIPLEVVILTTPLFLPQGGTQPRQYLLPPVSSAFNAVCLKTSRCTYTLKFSGA